MGRRLVPGTLGLYGKVNAVPVESAELMSMSTVFVTAEAESAGARAASVYLPLGDAASAVKLHEPALGM